MDAPPARPDTGLAHSKERCHSGCWQQELRPRTAVMNQSVFNVYETTNQREFGPPGRQTSEATRPGSARGLITHRDGAWTEAAEYARAFSWKPVGPTQPIRSGTASGNRRNNPQPSKAFLVWRLPNTRCTSSYERPSPSMTEAEIKTILSSQYQSTYRGDYLGTQQSVRVRQDSTEDGDRGALGDWRHGGVQRLLSEFQEGYRWPRHDSRISFRATNFGCNKNRHLPALGITPSVARVRGPLPDTGNVVTSYQQHYGEAHSSPGTQPLISPRSSVRLH